MGESGQRRQQIIMPIPAICETAALWSRGVVLRWTMAQRRIKLESNVLLRSAARAGGRVFDLDACLFDAGLARGSQPGWRTAVLGRTRWCCEPEA